MAGASRAKGLYRNRQLPYSVSLRIGSLSHALCDVAGKEYYALAWVMARASRAIAQTLQQIPDTSTAAVVIPDVPSLQPGRMYEASSPASALPEWLISRS